MSTSNDNPNVLVPQRIVGAIFDMADLYATTTNGAKVADEVGDWLVSVHAMKEPWTFVRRQRLELEVLGVRGDDD